MTALSPLGVIGWVIALPASTLVSQSLSKFVNVQSFQWEAEFVVAPVKSEFVIFPGAVRTALLATGLIGALASQPHLVLVVSSEAHKPEPDKFCDRLIVAVLLVVILCRLKIAPCAAQLTVRLAHGLDGFQQPINAESW
jgi:hypothetical protein